MITYDASKYETVLYERVSSKKLYDAFREVGKAIREAQKGLSRHVAEKETGDLASLVQR